MKKAIAAWICICLMIITFSAAAENDLTAVNVVVLEIEGTVEVANQSGNSVPVFNNMKLHSGYEVTTGEDSYAWMSLDDTKVAGLDSDSNMSVKKQGKQLVLLLDAGNMFFDVQAKLEKDEAMNVRTSNMVMGIHGTFGVVRAVSNSVTEVMCLDGQLDVRACNAVTGESIELRLDPGEIAFFQINEQQDE